MLWVPAIIQLDLLARNPGDRQVCNGVGSYVIDSKSHLVSFVRFEEMGLFFALCEDSWIQP